MTHSSSPYRIPTGQPPAVPTRAADQPAVELIGDGRTVTERALAIVRDVLVIITCLVLLYLVYRGYVLAGQLADALTQLQQTWGGR